MRPEPEFCSRSGSSCSESARETAGPSSGAVPEHSSWHSPVPYLFGGLAAMLGLIALALLVLACSYWKLSGHLDADEADDRDGQKPLDDGTSAQVFEEKVLVVMAGDRKPTYLATPIASHAAVTSSKANDDAEKKAPEGSSSLSRSTQSGDDAGSGRNRERGQNPQNKPEQ